MGPVPKKVRVGFPLNMVSPSTVPQGRKSESAVTTPVGWGASVVVVLDVVAVVPEVSPGTVVVTGGSVVTVDSSGPADTTLSPPATHAPVRRERDRRRGATLRIAASVGTGSE